MKPERDELLHDMLEDETSFRDQVLAQTLHGVRRRRAVKRRNRAIALAAVPVLLVLVMLSARRTDNSAPQIAALPPAGAPASAPLYEIPAAASVPVVATAAGLFEVIETGGATIARIETPNVPRGVELLTDEELLASFPGRPAALFSDGSGRKELVLLDEAQAQ